MASLAKVTAFYIPIYCLGLLGLYWLTHLFLIKRGWERIFDCSKIDETDRRISIIESVYHGLSRNATFGKKRMVPIMIL